MTSKSKGWEAFAKLLHNLLLRRSPSKAAILLHTCTHPHTQQGQLVFSLSFRSNVEKTTALKRQPRHTVVTHTRYPKQKKRKPFDTVQLESFFLPAAPACFLCFYLTRFSLSSSAHPLRCGTQLEKKKSGSLTRRLPIPALHLLQCACYNAPDALVTMHQKKMAVATVDLSSTMPRRNEKCTTRK